MSFISYYLSYVKLYFTLQITKIKSIEIMMIFSKSLRIKNSNSILKFVIFELAKILWRIMIINVCMQSLFRCIIYLQIYLDKIYSSKNYFSITPKVFDFISCYAKFNFWIEFTHGFEIELSQYRDFLHLNF